MNIRLCQKCGYSLDGGIMGCFCSKDKQVDGRFSYVLHQKDAPPSWTGPMGWEQCGPIPIGWRPVRDDERTNDGDQIESWTEEDGLCWEPCEFSWEHRYEDVSHRPDRYIRKES